MNDQTVNYVIGGRGSPVVLLHGWPQTWREWRPILSSLAQLHTVIAPDLRGLGETSIPPDGKYDGRTVAGDIRELCRGLGVSRPALVGHDIGATPAFAWAAGHPGEVSKLAIVESMVLGVATPPPPAPPGSQPYWHMGFHMVPGLAEALISGRERDYFGWFLNNFAAANCDKLSGEVDDAVSAYSPPGRLTAGFEHYRAMPISAGQNAAHTGSKLAIPCLGVGGDKCLADAPARSLQFVANDVTTSVVAGCGHWIPVERPAELSDILLDFLAR